MFSHLSLVPDSFSNGELSTAVSDAFYDSNIDSQEETHEVTGGERPKQNEGLHQANDESQSKVAFPSRPT